MTIKEMIVKFPKSIKCKKPKMTKGCWDRVSILDKNGDSHSGILEVNYGEYVYFQTPFGWRKFKKDLYIGLGDKLEADFRKPQMGYLFATGPNSG